MKASRTVAALLAAALCGVLLADGLRICPSCGREDEVGVAACPACGAALPPVASKDPPPEPAVVAPAPAAAATNAFDAAARDVAEARRCRAEAPEKALALQENALALLSAETGAAFNEKAATSLAREIKALQVEVGRRNPGLSARRLALARGAREASLFFKASDRVPFGRVWVPSEWPETLAPARLAAVRQALPPVCAGCAGLGFEVCHACNGRGRQPCRNPGCTQGWIYEKSANDLSPKTALKTRHKCPVCQGTTIAACTACNGDGAVICRKCGGSGEAPACKTCHGTGLADCRACGRATRAGAEGEVCRVCRGTRQALCAKCGGDGRTAR